MSEFKLQNLKPENLFKNFELLTRIPRESGNEKEVSDFLVDFGKKLNLETYQDEVNNVYIIKEATKGYENRNGIVIQGHMDIVAEKEKELDFNFKTDSINLQIKDDMIYATGTTLGADNGIAIAMAMTILEDDTIKHPRIELLATVDEEVGMLGADKIKPEHIKGKYMINIDSEEEGVITVSCAGGKNVIVDLPINYEKVSKNKIAFKVSIEGLQGGHSGAEIHLQRANANKLLGRLLNSIQVEYDIVSINGGSKSNAIPRDAQALILVEDKDVEKLISDIKDLEKIYKNEFSSVDSELQINIKEIENRSTQVLSKDSKGKVIEFILISPHGVQTFSNEIEDLVESSLNFAIIEQHEDKITFLSSARSSVISLREEICDRIVAMSKVFGGSAKIDGVYPAWEYAKDSNLEKTAVEVWKEISGVEPKVTAIHAGLECGMLLEKLPGFEAISIGPDIMDVHTPNEHISISSTVKVWNYLLELIQRLD
ncbi:MAG: aminoacyl-histidine dipeptidase [Clostridioides sp.]|jgi:dipeptidase D|nr:aminoacyl-histidine dipeptidase [Clostridioides sp.]